MVTREEMHSTRGRARILWEMLNGGELELWRDEEVFEALDLCLACKGCTKDCPVHVDIPTLKAEFLAHYYAGKPRPRHAYAFGLIDRAAKAAAQAPWLANAFAKTPAFKAAVGMAQERAAPAFAPVSLRDWFHRRPVVNPQGEKVILWPDTFNTYFHTEVGVASVEALEEAGYRVTMPREHLCCGRPLYDYGFLRLARRYLERVIDELRADLRAGVPVIGMEPSCVAVFKDELAKMLPDDEDGHRLCMQTKHFAEFLEGADLPPLPRRALLHGHCHHRATGGIEPEQKLLEAMGVEVEMLDSGCCGMAGSWGYEAGHYEVSQACGERGILPAVRGAGADAVVVADGFSCRHQIEQGATGRKALHIATVLELARAYGPAGPPGGRPEEAVPELL
jgi:Fe-S oxidoreductase